MTQAVSSKAKEGQAVPTAAGRLGQSAAPPAQPKPDHNEAMRLLAHQRLEQLFGEATAARFYGRIVIEVAFMNGRAETVHRRIEGADKPEISCWRPDCRPASHGTRKRKESIYTTG